MSSSTEKSGSPAFPAELLKAPIAERLAFFEQVQIRHPKLVYVEDELRTLLPEATNRVEDLTHGIIFGPTGSGKSVWGRNFAERYPRRIEQDRDVVHAVWFRTPMPCTWREFYIQALASGYNAWFPTKAVQDNPNTYPGWLEGKTEGALKRRLLAMARRTGTLIWIIDEIQQVAYARGGVVESLERLKHLADEAGVVLLLTGTYDARALLGLNGQLTRRFQPILLDRYRTFNQEVRDQDSKDFLRVLKAFERRLPLPHPPNLVDHAAWLHRHTLGLIGLLKPLLTRCLKEALQQGLDSISLDTLTHHRLSERRLQTLEGELLVDEAKDQACAQDRPLFAPQSSSCVIPQPRTLKPTRMARKIQP